jgi:hypothetical protein
MTCGSTRSLRNRASAWPRPGKEKNVTFGIVRITLFVLGINRIILAREQQARHGHGRQDLGEARPLKHLGPQGYERLQLVLDQPGSHRCW